MQVDKERATKMLDYMRATNKQWIQYGIHSDIAAQTDERARFSFRKFLVDNRLFQDTIEHNGDIWIPCPFHDDESPSCSINEDMYVYHCFSCDRKGNLINLISEYRNRYENSNASYYETLNSILINDQVAQAELGFYTIYGETSEEVQGVFEGDLKKFQFIPKRDFVYPDSYSELADMLIKRQANLKQIKLFILFMQNQMSPQDIYKEIYNVNRRETTEYMNEDSTTESSLSTNLQELLKF